LGVGGIGGGFRADIGPVLCLNSSFFLSVTGAACFFCTFISFFSFDGFVLVVALVVALVMGLVLVFLVSGLSFFFAIVYFLGVVVDLLLLTVLKSKLSPITAAATEFPQTLSTVRPRSKSQSTATSNPRAA